MAKVTNEAEAVAVLAEIAGKGQRGLWPTMRFRFVATQGSSFAFAVREENWRSLWWVGPRGGVSQAWRIEDWLWKECS